MFIYTTMPRNNLLAGNSKKNVFTELEALAQKKNKTHPNNCNCYKLTRGDDKPLKWDQTWQENNGLFLFHWHCWSGASCDTWHLLYGRRLYTCISTSQQQIAGWAIKLSGSGKQWKLPMVHGGALVASKYIMWVPGNRMELLQSGGDVFWACHPRCDDSWVTVCLRCMAKITAKSVQMGLGFPF